MAVGSRFGIRVASLAFSFAVGVPLSGVAQAADLLAPKVTAPAGENLVACPAVGYGFFKLPGTETCIKLGFDLAVETRFDSATRDLQFTTVRLPTFDDPLGGAPDLTYEQRRLYGNRYRTLVDMQLQVASATPSEYGPIFTFFSFRNIPSFTAADQGTVALGQDNFTLDQGWIKFAGFTAGTHKSYFDFTQPGYVHRGGYGSSRTLPLFAYTYSYGTIASATLSFESGGRRRYQEGVLANYGRERYADVVGQLRITPSWGILHLSGAWHPIEDKAALICCGAPTRQTEGWAVQAAAEYRTKWSDWFGAAAGNTYGRFMVSATAADGALDYLGIPFFTPDYVANPDGSLNKTRGYVGLVSYEHIWTPTLKSTIAYSRYKTRLRSNVTYLGDQVDPFNFEFEAKGSLFQVGTEYMPVPNLMLGAKVDYFRDTAQGYTLGVARDKEKVDFVNAWLYVRRRM